MNENGGGKKGETRRDEPLYKNGVKGLRMLQSLSHRAAFRLACGVCFSIASGLTMDAMAQTAQSSPAPSQVTGSATENPTLSGDKKNGITLNFVNADVRDVAKAVLGDYLKLNYEIGSGVQGNVTLQTSEPLSYAQVLPALEQALSLNNIVLVYSNGIYQVMPLADAHKQVRTPAQNGARAGYGVEVVHVKYMTAEQMQKLLQPLATAAEGSIRVDAARNLLIIEGTAQEREALIEDVSLFDADWLSGMSFELFQPAHMDADELAKELDPILSGISGTSSGVVRLVPIGRLNAVLAIASQPRYLQQLRGWVARLDKPAEGTDKKIFVYHVQNGRATDVANTLLRALFGSGAPQQAAPQPTQNSAAGGSQGSDSSAATNSGILSSMNAASVNDFSAGNVTGGTTPSHPSTPASAFQPVTTPVQGQAGGGGRSYETIGGVSQEGINSVNITADEANNALVVLATPREYAVIQDALRQLDVAPIQVLLEASIAEVTLTRETQFGFQYFAQNSHNQAVLTQSNTLPASSGPPILQIAPSLPGFSYMFMNGNSIQVILNALGTVTHVEVISSPEVMVLNNQMASLEVGDQVPILTGQSQSTVGTDSPVINSIQYLDTGVILRVTPRVNRSGQVMMDISQEVSGVNTTATSVSTIGSPTIQQRKINSSVAVSDGETVALGGLFSDNLSLSHNGIPYLQDIPLLGNLFRSTDNSHDRTELMVLITPHVVDDALKARAVTDELRRKLPEVEPLFHKPG